MLNKDFSNVFMNMMCSYLSGDAVKGSFKGRDALDLIYLSPMCTNIFDLYGIVLLMWLSHINDLGMPRGYETVTEEGLMPAGRIDVGAAIESGIYFTGGLVWHKEVLTQDTIMNRLLKGYGLMGGRKALDNIRLMLDHRQGKDGNERLAQFATNKRYIWAEHRLKFLLGDYLNSHEVSREITFADIEESYKRMSTKYFTLKQALGEIKSLSEYDLGKTKLDMRNGLSNYSIAFRSAFDLIDRYRYLLGREKTSAVSLLTLIPKLRRDGKMASEEQQKRINSEFDLYFAYHNRDVLRQGVFGRNYDGTDGSGGTLTDEYYTPDDIDDLVKMQMTQLEGAYIGSMLMRSKVKEFAKKFPQVGSLRLMDVGGQTWGAFGFELSSNMLTGVQIQGVKDKRLLILNSCLPSELMLFEHCGELGRESEFKDLIRIIGYDQALVDDAEEILLVTGRQLYLSQSDTVGFPPKQTVNRGAYITGDIYFQDGMSYFFNEIDKIDESLHKG